MELIEGRAADAEALLADLEPIGEQYGVTIQAFDARLVAGPGHLEAAVEHADRAIKRDENVARDRAVEILLYAAGCRQIDRALEMGIEDGAPAVVLVDGDDETGAAAAVTDLLGSDASIDGSDRHAIREFFDISSAELDAAVGTLEDLVRERVALLDVEK